MSYKLESKKSLGIIRLLNEDGTKIKEYLIGEGRLSITPKEDYYLLCFWVMAEYDFIFPDGSLHLASGPIIQILTKIFQLPINSEVLLIKVLTREEMESEWDINYRTGYYNGWHNYFDNAELKIQNIQQNIFLVEFIGEPSEDNIVSGKCEIELSTELKRFW